MIRREILQLAGGTLTAGIGAGLVGNRQEQEEGDENGEEEQEDPVCEPDIQFGETELIVDESGFSATAFAEVVVENVGNAPSGELSITAAWMDADETFIDDDFASLPTLGEQETWVAYIRALTEPEEIEDFEVSGEFEVGHPRAPERLAITNSEFDQGENEITGVAENSREDDIERVEAQGKIYDDEGTVLGGGTTWESDHPAGRNWNFEIFTPQLPGGVEPVDHDVMLDAQSYQIQ